MEKKEISMEARLLLAFLLMGIVLLVSQYFIQPPPATPTATNKTAQTAATTPSTPPAATPPPVQPPAAAFVPGQVQAEKEDSYTIETRLYKVVFSNRGAVAKNWILKAYKDSKGQPLDLVYAKAAGRVPLPFAVNFKSQPAPSPDPNAALYKATQASDGQSIEFEYSDGRTAVKKSFKFDPQQYLVQVSSEASENGVPRPHSLVWRGGFGDSTVVNVAQYQHTVFYDISKSKLNQKDVKAAKDNPVTDAGQYSFAGIEDSYFAGVFLPGNGKQVELTTFADNVPAQKDGDEQRIGAAVGGDGQNAFSLYAGPKDIDLLRRVNPRLEQLIDWGWFEFMAKPLFLGLNWVADKAVHNYGWAIVLVTIIINMLLFPLKITSMKSSKKMQALQPQINAINAKYKSLSVRDPKKAEQNQELMDLYKKHGVNPVGGCLPMLLQLPFFFAFLKVLNVTIELRGATWLWVSDLSQPETLALRVLPILLIVFQFVQQKMTPSPGMDPTQQKVMLIMPVMLGYFFYFQPAGLVLYWLTSNVVGIAQQWLLNRGTPAPVVAPPAPAAKKKNRN